MTTKHRYQFVGGVLAWCFSSVFVLVLTGWFSYELVFLMALIGLLIVTKLTSPAHFQPSWRRRLRWPVLLGIGWFLVIVVRRTLVALPLEGI